MNLLITGASGSLGQRLIPALLVREKVNIRTLAHRTPVEFPACEAMKGELADLDSLVAATDGIDTVLHLAALTHSPRETDYFAVNAEGTRNLLEACRHNKVQRFIFMSSGAAHPDGGAYSASKLAAEQAVQQSELSWLILRPREVYGTGGKEGINQLISWVRKFPVVPVIGNGRYLLSPVFIDDVVSATVEAVFGTDVEGQTYVLAGPDDLAFTALIDRLADYFGVSVGKFFVPIPLLRGMIFLLNGLNIQTLVRDQIPRLLCDKSSPENPEIPLLNFRPRKLEDGLRSCFPREG
ncbi:MAG: NAD-dependent epimerase/dehydratase family protein [Nitrospinae bacterium]|nr:NAD-dependent epimerase/dehydratase family protein [Nitrospinota bacterium]